MSDLLGKRDPGQPTLKQAALLGVCPAWLLSLLAISVSYSQTLAILWISGIASAAYLGFLWGRGAPLKEGSA